MHDNYIIYGKDNCQYCDRAKRLLDSKNLPYTYLKLGVNFSREDLLEIAPHAKSFPQIWYYQDDKLEPATYIGGYTELEKHFMNEVEVALNEGAVVSVVFTKADGTERKMLCTKNPEVIAEKYTAPEKKTDRVRGETPGLLSVFDLEKNDWRSFRVDSVKSYMIFEEA